MKLTSGPLDLTRLVISEEQSQSRTSGIHVSSILKHIRTTINPEKGKFSDDDLQDFALVGRLWERVVSDALYTPPRYERIGEIEKDDIIGSPDCIDTQDWAVRDFKVTWTSWKGFEDRFKFREYGYQIQSYCYMLGMVRAHLDVLHIRGDYTTGKPIPWTYNLLYSTGELRSNWMMMKAQAKDLVESELRRKEQ